MEEFLGRQAGTTAALVARGIGALVVFALAGALLLSYTGGTFSDDVVVHARIDDIGGSLANRADVKSRGVIVGHTGDVEPTDDGVVVELSLDREKAAGIPSNVMARILPATVFGTSYVDLAAPDAPATAPLRAGQSVEQDTRAATLELQTTLDSTNEVLTAVKPAELSMTLEAMSQAFDGQGEEIGTSLVKATNLLRKVNPKMPLIRENLRLLADNMETVNAIAPEMFSAIDNGLVSARTLVAKRVQLTDILTGSGALVDDAEAFMTSQEKAYIEAIGQSADTIDAYYDNRRLLAPGVLKFNEFGSRGRSALRDGPFLSTNARIVTSGGTEYTAADCPRYGPVSGDNCGAGGGRSAASAAVSDGDGALIRELQGILGELEGSDDDGVGELLSRPYLGSEAP